MFPCAIPTKTFPLSLLKSNEWPTSTKITIVRIKNKLFFSTRCPTKKLLYYINLFFSNFYFLLRNWSSKSKVIMKRMLQKNLIKNKLYQKQTSLWDGYGLGKITLEIKTRKRKDKLVFKITETNSLVFLLYLPKLKCNYKTKNNRLCLIVQF